MTTTQGQIYLIALSSLERLDIQFVPDVLPITRTANIAEIAVVGRNTPQHHYTGGTEGIELKLDFFASEENRQDVRKKCNWLRSLCYSDGNKKPPEKVKLVWGDLFRDEEFVVRSVKVEYSLFNREFGFLPQQAYVNIALSFDPNKNVKWKDIK